MSCASSPRTHPGSVRAAEEGGGLIGEAPTLPTVGVEPRAGSELGGMEDASD